MTSLYQISNMISDSIIVLTKEVGRGIKISFGEEKLTCFVVSHKLQAGIFYALPIQYANCFINASKLIVLNFTIFCLSAYPNLLES